MTKEILLNKNKIVLIDDCDFENLKEHKYFNLNNRAAIRHQKKSEVKDYNRKKVKMILMHREIMESILGRKLKENEQIDHINRNGFDNRRCNLRLCNYKENGANANIRIDNSSGFRGVYWNKNKEKWHAQISSKPRIYLGLFTNPEDAARAYDKKAIELYGEFASLNFPEECK